MDDIFLGTLNTVNNLAVGSFDKSGNIFLAPNFTPTPGNHILKIFTINPNGKADLKPENDTTTIPFIVAPEQSLPYAESFETPPLPPPNGAAIINLDNNDEHIGNKLLFGSYRVEQSSIAPPYWAEDVKEIRVED